VVRSRPDVKLFFSLWSWLTKLVNPLVCLCCALLQCCDHCRIPKHLRPLSDSNFVNSHLVYSTIHKSWPRRLNSCLPQLMLAQFAFRMQSTHASHRACPFQHRRPCQGHHSDLQSIFATGRTATWLQVLLLEVGYRMFAMHGLDPYPGHVGKRTFSTTGRMLPIIIISIERSWPPIVTAGDCGDLKEHWSDCRGQDTLVIVERAILRSSN